LILLSSVNLEANNLILLILLMNKKIITIGYEVPGQSDNYIGFDSRKSLMDADILIISPEFFTPDNYGYVSFNAGGGCYNPTTSSDYENKILRLNKELIDYLHSGKTVFLILAEKKDFYLSNGTSSPRKGQTNYNTYKKSNYSFLPINLGVLTSASGKAIEFSGNSMFSNFYREFKENLEYQLYIENKNDLQIIFTGKDKTKILGAVYKIGIGHVVALPCLEYDEDKFIKYDEKGDKQFWTEDAIKFGYRLRDCLIAIDQKLTSDSEKTPTPKWANKKDFLLKNASIIEKIIEKNLKKVNEINLKNEQLEKEFVDKNSLKDLLFEQGKSLEKAVIKALIILGYHAENYNDGILEIDQVITSPENHRYIGECEGKDDKDINITKFRQLLESLNADFEREDVSEKAYGILFGNPQRLIEPNKRNLDFTKKCKVGANREKIALIKTVDLFFVAQYLSENKNEKFKKDCRDAIYKGLGEIVKFPQIPKE